MVVFLMFMSALGVIVALFGVGFLYKNWSLNKKGISTMGTITNVRAIHKLKHHSTRTIISINFRHSYKYKPTIRFLTPTKTIEEESFFTINSAKTFHVGKRVHIKYNPNDPTQYNMTSPNLLKQAGVICLLIGCGFIIICLFMYLALM